MSEPERPHEYEPFCGFDKNDFRKAHGNDDKPMPCIERDGRKHPLEEGNVHADKKKNYAEEYRGIQIPVGEDTASEKRAMERAHAVGKEKRVETHKREDGRAGLLKVLPEVQQGDVGYKCRYTGDDKYRAHP